MPSSWKSPCNNGSKQALWYSTSKIQNRHDVQLTTDAARKIMEEFFATLVPIASQVCMKMRRGAHKMRTVNGAFLSRPPSPKN